MTSGRTAGDAEDQAWFESLIKGVADARYDSLQTYISQLITEKGVDILSPDVDRGGATATEALSALRSLHSSAEDSYLVSVFEQCLQTMEEHRTFQSVDLFLVQVPAPSLNGFAVKAPSGSPVIVLNHGLVNYTSCVVHLVLALTGFSDGRYCDHHDSDAAIDGLFELGAGVLTDTPALLLNIPAIGCLGGPLHQATASMHETACRLIEMFVILHELAHVGAGHLDPYDTSRAPLLGNEHPALEVDVFNRAHEAEFAADRIAASILLEQFDDPSAAASSCLHAVGCFLILLRVIELSPMSDRLDSHPRARERWDALSALHPARPAPSMLDSIDALMDFFDRIESATDPAS